MKDQWQKECADLRAELATLQKQLHALETKRAEANVSATPISRWRWSKSIMAVLMPFVALLAASGVLYGQGAFDALFIDQQGRVGIGRTDPNATLDVAGTLNVTKNTSLADTKIKGTLTTEGNVGIGTTSLGATLDVSGKADTNKQIALQLRSGNTNSNYNSNQVTFGYNNTDTYRHAIKTRHHGGQIKGNAIDFYVWKYEEDKVDATAIGGLHTMTLDGGDVGIGTPAPKDKLDVAGPLRVLTGSNPIRFTSGWSGFPNESGVTNQAEISNDTKDYKSLMIVGNMSGGGTTRRVKVFDQLEVAGDLVVNGLPIRKEIQPNPSKNASRNEYRFPIDPHCSDSDGCRVKIWSEPPRGKSDEFAIITIDIAVSGGGSGNTDRRIRMVDHWADVQCQVTENCGRHWWGNVKLNVATNNLLFSIDPKWHAMITIYGN